MLVSDQRVQSTRCTNNDVRECILVLQDFNVLADVNTTIEDSCFDIREVFAESSVFISDLVGQFSRVTHDKDRAFSRNWFQLV